MSNGTNNSGSLLAQALEVPNLNDDNNQHDQNPLLLDNDDETNSLMASTSSFSPRLSSTPRTSHHQSVMEEAAASNPTDVLLLPQHSDYTIPTSNLKAAQQHYYQQQQQEHLLSNQKLQQEPKHTASPGSHSYFPTSPPAAITPQQNKHTNTTTNRPRSILGNNVKSRYYVRSKQETAATTTNPNTTPPRQQQIRSASLSPPSSPRLLNLLPTGNPTVVSPLTPYDRRFQEHTAILDSTSISQQQKKKTKRKKNKRTSSSSSSHLPKPKRLHETIHAQSLLIGIAFMAIWSPSNLMAPNLTQMATVTFHMTPGQRDLYLGSYCALAVGVFSLPISALLGFMVDFYSRKHLFVACIIGCSISTAWTALCTDFVWLFISRICTGGFMSASVSISFSLLGDLFSTEERNAASSGLTAMMGCGILVGQVYSGVVGPRLGWTHPFWVSSCLSLLCAVGVAIWVREPDRGAKEVALQALLKNGEKYERKLTLTAFLHAMKTNASNKILLWSGFFTSLPWGIVFVFLNDYLSQEKGFSVPDATFMVMLFGIGTAIGGVGGGYVGQLLQKYNRSYLPLYMALATFLGIVPFVGLLNSDFPNPHGYKAMGYSILGGCIASLPSVNVRPCLLNVNPPETRGAALTAANLLVALGRGIGPSCITVLGSGFGLSRQTAFNTTLTGFWTIAAIQLLFLAKSLPDDQDAMEAELARYAASLSRTKEEEHSNNNNNNNDGGDNHMDLTEVGGGDDSIATDGDGDKIDYYTKAFGGGGGEAELTSLSRGDGTTTTTTNSLTGGGVGGGSSSTYDHLQQRNHHPHLLSDDELDSLLSMEEYITPTFDGQTARQSLRMVKQGIQEIKEEMACMACVGERDSSSEEDDEEEAESPATLERRKEFWKKNRQRMNHNNNNNMMDDYDVASVSSIANENTPLLVV